MILSRGRRYLFIHIPKTGGTSMALALEARTMKDDLMLGDTPKARQRRHRLAGAQAAGRLWKHSTLSDLDGVVGPPELETLFVFTMVRNPWDRLVSYYHWIKGQRFAHPHVALAAGSDFAGFVSDASVMGAFRAAPARSYVTDRDSRECCNLFVRLEHLDTDLRPLEAHLGFALHLPHINASARAPGYRSMYDDRTAGLVAQACAEDIARFGYVY